ncbi:MAG: hypothetical protein MI749_01110 [Desulfovibrionales bacterium]|nr:hypothetical protein [Desulfovibrionales bacterium]
MKENVRVVGWGQITQPKDTPHAKDVMGLMVAASQRAAEHLKRPSILQQMDGIMVVRSLSTHYDSAATTLARLLHSRPGFSHVSLVGGNSPQTQINKAAAMIARGELNMVLVAGAETYVPRNPDLSKPDSALMKGIPEDYPGDDAVGATPVEIRHGMEHPMQGFPLFETALWHASGHSLQTHLTKVGKMWSTFNDVAATHPYAWTHSIKSPGEIITPSPKNRPVAFPYTKYMNAFVTVDQGAAVILMSESMAEKCARSRKRPVYFTGGGYAQDRQRFMVEKSDFTSSPPLKAAVDKALDRADLDLEKIECFDLYSCFPCAVSIAKKMLKISDDDPRPLTLTGGLGFFGGPGNNYNLHAVATLAEKIAGGEYKTGMVTALGWFMHKHAAGIYSCHRPHTDLSTMDKEDETDYLAGATALPSIKAPRGKGHIETYTIIYHPDHTPRYAILYGLTPDGKRFVANTPDDPQIYATLTEDTQVGRPVRFSTPSPKHPLVAQFV